MRIGFMKLCHGIVVLLFVVIIIAIIIIIIIIIMIRMVMAIVLIEGRCGRSSNRRVGIGRGGSGMEGYRKMMKLMWMGDSMIVGNRSNC